MKKTTLITTFIFMGISTMAMGGDLRCHTPRHEKVFIIQQRQVLFLPSEGASWEITLKKPGQHKERTLSSTPEKFTKYLRRDGYDYYISLKDVERPNAHHDFLSISNRKGWRMSYPLTCLKQNQI